MRRNCFPRILVSACLITALIIVNTGCKKEVQPVIDNSVERFVLIVNDIKTGEAVEDARIQLFDYQVETNAEGLAFIELPAEHSANLKLLVNKSGYTAQGHSLDYKKLIERKALSLYLNPIGSHSFITSSGGTITDDRNNELVVPEGALSSGSEIYMNVQPYTSLSVDKDFLPILSVEIQSSIEEFNVPVEIKLTAPEGEEYGFGEPLYLMYFDDETMKWVDSGIQLKGGSKGKKISAKVNSAKVYALGKVDSWGIDYSPMEVTELDRAVLFSTDICRYLYGWRDGVDGNKGKGNDKVIDECLTGTLKGGNADHEFDVTLTPLPAELEKVPGIMPILKASVQAVKDELYTLIPKEQGHNTNYRLRTGYEVCLEVCWCQELDLEQFRNRVNFTDMPVLWINYKGTVYEVPFATAWGAYNDLEVILGTMTELDKSICHEGGGGGKQ